VTSSLKLAEETGLSRQQIRTALEKLVSTNDITMSATKSFTHIKVLNWVKYQQETTNKVTNEQPTDNQQVTTIEEGNKEIKKEVITVKDDVYMQA
jgi:pantoate kinase